MSPALIDITTPSKPSFLPQNPNPSNPISSSLLFDISSSTFGEPKSMNSSVRNSNEGGFDYVFREEPKLRTVSGRSMPRLVKVRKHASSNRGRSRSIAESQIPSDFNPFCGGSVRVDDESRFQELYEKYNSQNNSSGSSISEDFELGKPDDSSSFVFGVRNSNYEKSGFDGNLRTSSLPDEMKNLNIGSGSSKGKSNVFVFGSSKKDSSLDSSAASKLEDEMTKLNIASFGNVEKTKVDKAGDFVFGRSGGVASAFDKTVDAKLPFKMQNLNIKDTGNSNVGDAEKKKGSDKNSFVFGNSRSGGSSLGGGATSVLPNEMKKLNINDSKVGDNVEEPKDDRFKVNTKNFFVFGSNKSDSESFSSSTINMLPDEMSKLNMGSDIGNPSAFPDTTSSSSFNAQSKVSTDKVFNDPGVSNSRRGSFSSQARKSSRSSSVGSDQSVQLNDDSKSSGASTSSYSFYSAGLSFQSSGKVSEESTVDRPGNKAEFAFGTSRTDVRTPKQDASCSSTASSFASLNQKMEFSAMNGAVKDTKFKKKRGKTKQAAAVHQSGQYNISSENSFQENAESPGCYSPMDVSPYRETLTADKSSRGTSVTSDEYIQLDTDRPAADAYSSVSADAIDEDFVTATESLDINEDDANREESKEGCMDNFENDVHVGNEYLRSKIDENVKIDASVAAIERDTGFHSRVESTGNGGRMKFCSTTSCENVNGPNFTFAASTSVQGHTPAVKRHYKKKSRLKSGQDSYNSTLTAKLQFTSPETSFFPLSGRSSDPVTEQNRKGDSSLSQFMGENRAEGNKEAKVKEGSISAAAATTVAHEACEKWRLRGNQAYRDENLSKAEDYYTRGLNCVPRNETSEACLTALTLCYSNRAAARMSSGRMRAALEDCKNAAEINPDFRKVQVRAANCHLALGEIEDALQYFKNSLPPGADLCLDRKIVIEASNGLQKAQKAGEYLNRCGELLRRRTSSDAESALQIIAEALLVCPYSEKLVELKADALLMLRKYEETIQLCEQSLDSADKNSSSVSADGSESIKISPARLWRWGLMAKSYFYLGRLEEALTFLEKLEQAEPFAQKFGIKTPEFSSTLSVTVRELLRHKAAGNEAFQSGKHSEAVEHYTSALSCNLESRPFAAICFCNRAAAHQALGQITEAIADCSLAIALDGNYPKAISRIATLHEMIRDYSQAAIDLQRLVSLLEKQTGENSNPSGRLGRSTSGIMDLRQTHSRLSTMEEEAKKGIPLDLYLILGIESSSVGTDIKKAYRRAALRHHPDKAAQVLPRSENGDDGVWREIGEAVYNDADRLFKMIGEAYAVLSDPVKRFQYDDEEIRYTKKGNGSTSRTSSDVHNSPFERSGNGRQWQEEVRRSYRNQSSHWSEAPRTSRYF